MREKGEKISLMSQLNILVSKMKSSLEGLTKRVRAAGDIRSKLEPKCRKPPKKQMMKKNTTK